MAWALETPDQFAGFYTSWLAGDEYKKLNANGALTKKIVIGLKTANMTVKAAPKDTLDLSVVKSAAVEVMLTDEFKSEKDKELVIKTGDNDNAYRVQLPETSKAFKLDVCGEKATLKLESASSTEIDILTPKFTNSANNNARRGLLIGDGITVKALNPVDGYVYLNGGTIEAWAIIPGSTPAQDAWARPVYEEGEDGNLVPAVDGDGNPVMEVYQYLYNYNYVTYEGGANPGYNSAKDYDKDGNVVNYHYFRLFNDPTNISEYNWAYINTMKVFKGNGATAYINVSASNYLFLSKLVIADDANVKLSGASVAEIEGGSKKTGKVEINSWNSGKMEKVSNVTISTSNSINLKQNVENCIFASGAAYVYVYPQAEVVKGTEFKKSEVVRVVAPSQAEGVSTYTQTFTGCKFNIMQAPPYDYMTNPNLFGVQSYSADAQILYDNEGNPIMRDCWFYYEQGTDGWWYRQGPVFDFSEVPEEAKLLDPDGGTYWEYEQDYAYYATGFENAKDYTVIMDLDGCTTTDGAKIKETLNIYTAGGSKPALRYAFGGSDLYKGVSGYWDHEGPSHVILVKDSKR